ncbi:MAG: B12-binding domain-containing radical SAM protein [Syntrophobacteraceae bacterium]
MNYLLVMPSGLSRSQDQHFYVFSVGIAYISASLKAAGFSVFTANLDFCNGDTYSIMHDLIISNHIDVLCTGGLSRDCNKVRELIEIARTINPGLITVAGGGLISADPEPAMHVIDADIGVIGEGEITMCELAEAFEKGLPYDNLPGLIFKDSNGGLTTTKGRTLTGSIDSIPFPDYDGFDYAKFVNATGMAVVACSRSCTHACTFCYRPQGQKYRQRSLSNIMEEIDIQIDRYHPKFIGLTDNLFASSKQRVLEFCNLIRKRNISWACSLHVSDTTDLDMLQEMKAAGCCGINYGLESADESVLKSMRKGSSVEQIERALENIWNADIHLQANFIFGDINETKETVANTLKFINKYKSRFLFAMDPIVAFPGSRIYKYACSNGFIKDKEQFLKDNCPVINISKLTEPEFNDMLGMITESRLAPRVPMGSFHIAEVQADGQCKVEWTCRKCGGQESVNLIFWYSMDVICNICGTVNHIDPFEKAFHSTNSLFNEMPNNGTVVLWGAGGIYYKLMHKYDFLRSERFILADSNKSRQGQSMCSKEILSPDIIAQSNIKTVVITALSQKDAICASLVSGYPSVEHILIPAFDITQEGVVPILKPIEMATN